MKVEDIENIELEYLSLTDYKELKAAMVSSYLNMHDAFWTEKEIGRLINKFPEGQVVIKINGKLAGCALSIIVDYAKFENNHTYKKVTGNYTFNTHTDEGDVLYGIDVFIVPGYRGMRLGRRLYDYRKELCEKLNLKSIVFGGRMPNYNSHSNELTPKEYIAKVRRKEIQDPVLNFQISNDFHPAKVMKGYLPGDKASNDFAILMEWDNIYYQKPSKKAATKKTIIRLGLIQWQMRPYKDLEELLQQAEYFIDAVSGYRSDFALFPEFFN